MHADNRRTYSTRNIVYGELGRFPLQLQRYFKIINYWLKIVCHKGNPSVCKMYDSLYKRLNEDENIINWASLTQNLLFKLYLQTYGRHKA